MNTKERILQIVAVALLAYALWSFASVQLELKQAVARSAELDAQLAELQRQNTELEEKQAHSRDDATIESIARERACDAGRDRILFYIRQRGLIYGAGSWGYP